MNEEAHATARPCGCGRQFSAITGSAYEGTKVPAATLVRIVTDGGLSGTVRGDAQRYGISTTAIQNLRAKIASHPGS